MSDILELKKVSPNPECSALERAPWPYASALVIAAHPDDETLWAGGTMLMHPEVQWAVVTLCRRNDADRAPRFRRVLADFCASGDMADLDDGPDVTPLPDADVQDAVLSVASHYKPDLILTHSVLGEYTRHIRHEEAGRAVLALWDQGKLQSREVWTFAYGDGGARPSIHAVSDADMFTVLPESVWAQKRALITEIYGFAADSFEAKAALREEAFWRVRPLPQEYRAHIN